MTTRTADKPHIINPNLLNSMSRLKSKRVRRIFAVFLTLSGIATIAFSTLYAVNRGSSGRVTSAYGPVEGANVRVPGQMDYEISGADGRFTIPEERLSGRRTRIVAGKEGWFNTGAIVQGRNTTINMSPLPTEDDKHYRYWPITVCARCHLKLSKIYESSKMAETTFNPKVLSMYNKTEGNTNGFSGPTYREDHPDQKGDCVFCHAPSIAATTDTLPGLDEPAVTNNVEWNGISCEYCHKIKKVIRSDETPSGFKAIHQRVKPNSGDAILVFGPYDDVAVPPMGASYNPLYEKGQYCSLCHSHLTESAAQTAWDWRSIYTPEEWKSFGIAESSKLPIQTTYQEWRAWQTELAEGDPNKGKTCQNCHMSWRKDMLPYDNSIVMGHAQMMWGTRRDSQTIHPHQFDGGTETQLKTAVSLEIDGAFENDALEISVFVSNSNGGHWVPTGEPLRSVILLVEAVGDNGEIMTPIAGDTLPSLAGTGAVSEGNYSGKPGVIFAKILQDSEGNLGVPHWKASGIYQDNRIRPKTTVTLKWRFRLSDPDSEPTVTARLLYRSAPKHIQASKGWQSEDILIQAAAW